MSAALFGIISITVGFISGIVALFAPCCFTILLPVYFAQIVQTKLRVVLATLVFALGIASVMLPIALGFRMLVTVFNRYHLVFYSAGGLLMILVGLLLIGQFKLPMWVTPRLSSNRATFGSLYLLGITSGLATACCAPVLVGAIAVTSLSPTWLLAILVGTSYVLGMVLPLLAGSLLANTQGLIKLRQAFNRSVGVTSIGSLVGGLTMIGYGLFLLIVTVTGRLSQLQEAESFNRTASLIGRTTSKFLNEQPVAAVVALAVIIILVVFVFNQLKLELRRGGERDD